MLLSAHGVSRSFGRLRALQDATLDIREHEIVGLIGPNGAGKSTFFNCLAGDLAPTSGQVIFEGRDVTRAPPETHARLVVRRIHERGVTLVIVEHIMEVIMTLAERVLVFNQGKTIASGKPREVVTNPAVIEAYLARRHARDAGAHAP